MIYFQLSEHPVQIIFE